MSSVLLLGSIVLGQLETQRRQQWETTASAPDSWGRATAPRPRPLLELSASTETC